MERMKQDCLIVLLHAAFGMFFLCVCALFAQIEMKLFATAEHTFFRLSVSNHFSFFFYNSIFQARKNYGISFG